jgi:mono/diheme cytochrome c family protein
MADLKCVLTLSAIAAMSVACRQDMHDQPRYKPLEKSDFFADGRSARPLVAGTVSRGNLIVNNIQNTGMEGAGFVDTVPLTITRTTLGRGQERYNIYCSPCHGHLGDGGGMIVLRGFEGAPSFHTDRTRALPAGYIFSVITNGFGAMPPYADQVPRDDRWAIVAYLRVLQYSQHAPLSDVPPDMRSSLESPGGAQ